MVITQLCLSIAISFVLVSIAETSPFGPPFPITASWFLDRYTSEEWNQTLAEFQSIGGDTVMLKAPPMGLVTRSTFYNKFEWSGCVSTKTPRAAHTCYDQAIDDTTAAGLNVSAVLIYNYDENYSDVIMKCAHDMQISSDNTYHRIVLPTNPGA